MTPRENRRRRRLVLGLTAIALSALVVAAVVGLGFHRGPARPQPTPTVGDAAPAERPAATDRPALAVVARAGAGPHRVSGVVVDAAGGPVVGASVTAEVEAGPNQAPSRVPADAGVGAGPEPAIVAVAVEEGRFELIGLATTTYRLRVDGEGIFTAEVRYVDVPGPPLRLVVARKVALTGRVVADGPLIAGVPMGIPAAGVEVGVIGYRASGPLTTITDVAGDFRFTDLAEGSYRVWAAAEEVAAPAVDVDLLGAGPFPPVTLRLQPAAVVTGRVVDVASGRGMVAAVTLSAERSGEPDRYASSDGDGRFHLPGIPLGRWSGVAYAPGYIAVESQSFTVGRGYSPTLEMTPGGIVSGVVVDPEEVPVRGAVVTLRTAADDAGQSRSISAVTRREQAARARGKPSGGVAPGQRFLPRGELGVLLGPIPFPPPPGGAVRVATVVGAGADPAADPTAAAMTVSPELESSFVTDEQGRFQVAGLAPGQYVVTASHRDFADARGKPLVIDLGGKVGGVRVVMVPGVVLFGAVTDEGDQPVVGATLTAEIAGDESTRLQAVTGPDGSYRLGPIGARVIVDVVATGYGSVRREVAIDKPGRTLVERKEEFVLVRADAVAAGRVVDGSGFAVRGARIELAARERYGASRYGVTDDTGTFTIAGLAKGSYSMRVSHSDFPPRTATATTSEPVRVTLPFGGGVAGEVRDLHTHAALAGARVVASGPDRARHEVRAGEGGEIDLVPLAAGTWTFAVSHPGYVASRVEVDVKAAAAPRAITVRDRVFELGRGATLAGIIRDGNGDRVRGATVEVGAARATSDEDGRFRLVDVATGEVTLEARRGTAAGRLSLTLQPGDEVVTLELEIR